MTRYRVCARALHLDVGWRWMIVDLVAGDLLEESFEGQADAQARATRLEAIAAYDKHRSYCRRRPSYCHYCRDLRALADPAAPPAPTPKP